MSDVLDHITNTIGNTPLVKVNKLITGGATVLAKLESLNPMSSVKDRIALSMILAGERDGKVKPDTLVIEPTSGNTGIGLAFVCATRGYKCLLTMPDSMSVERRKVLRALGADLVLTPAAEGMNGAINRAGQIMADTPGSWIPQQFNNPANPEVHRKVTAEEIWAATDGKVDMVVAGVGTGGTITGIAEALKAKNPEFKAIAVEPAESPIMTQQLAGEALKPGPHKIQGIGAGFIPEVLNMDVVDEVVQIDQDTSMDWARRSAKIEGLFVGISSGAALAAADKIAARPENKDKVIAVIIPSFGERYLSSALFAGLGD